VNSGRGPARRQFYRVHYDPMKNVVVARIQSQARLVPMLSVLSVYRARSDQREMGVEMGYYGKCTRYPKHRRTVSVTFTGAVFGDVLVIRVSE